jgi:hypothetical protein
VSVCSNPQAGISCGSFCTVSSLLPFQGYVPGFQVDMTNSRDQTAWQLKPLNSLYLDRSALPGLEGQYPSRKFICDGHFQMR